MMHTTKRTTRTRLTVSRRGFSLVEIAIVLVIVGLMIGGLLTPLTVQMEQRRVADTRRMLEDAREALVGYAVRHGHLPCPAISAVNGEEDRSGDRCTDERRDGFLPWATLGVPKLDAWNRLYRYSVTPAFADSGQRFKIITPRDITVYTRDVGGALAYAAPAQDVPAPTVNWAVRWRPRRAPTRMSATTRNRT